MYKIPKPGLIDQSKVTLVSATSSDKTLAAKMVRKLIKDMWTEYGEGVNFSQSGVIDESRLELVISQWIAEKRFYIARLDQQTVGFTVLRLESFQAPNIEYAFVEKKFRGKGIGTQLYQLAIQEPGALSISLLFRRVNTKIAYWKSLGFRSLTFRNSQSTRYGNIVKLSVEEFPSILSCELESRSIWAFRKRLQKAELQIKTVERESNRLRLKVSPNSFSEALKIKRIA